MQHDTMKNLLSWTVLASLADELEATFKLQSMSGYHNARSKVMPRITDGSEFRIRYTCVDGEYRLKSSDNEPRAKIHVFCPPLLQYVHFALALAPPDSALKTCEFQVVIHPDDRLLDETLYSVEEGHESLLQLDEFVRYSAELGEPIDAFVLGVKRESRRQFLAARFDQVWMDQRITALASDKRTDDEINASTFFRESKEAVEVALTVLMAGPQVCDNITRTAPLTGPDNPVQPYQIYRLEELADVDDTSLFRWKTRHFCRINSP